VVAIALALKARAVTVANVVGVSKAGGTLGCQLLLIGFGYNGRFWHRGFGGCGQNRKRFISAFLWVLWGNRANVLEMIWNELDVFLWRGSGGSLVLV